MTTLGVRPTPNSAAQLAAFRARRPLHGVLPLHGAVAMFRRPSLFAPGAERAAIRRDEAIETVGTPTPTTIAAFPRSVSAERYADLPFHANPGERLHSWPAVADVRRLCATGKAAELAHPSSA
jgi:hypothetical protein